MGKHDTKPATNQGGKSDMTAEQLEEREERDKKLRAELEAKGNPKSGDVLHMLGLALNRYDRIAVALERLADRFAPETPVAPVVHGAVSAYPECPAGHRMQPTDAECQTCIREKAARKPLPR